MNVEKNNPYNDLKLLYHTKELGEILNHQRVAPIYVRIKPTNVCNQNCYYCAYSNDKVFEERNVDRRESIPWERMKSIIDDMKEMGVKAVTFSGGGEPLCYHSIIPTIKLIKQYNIDFSIITNAQELTGEKADLLSDAKWVRVSLDSSNFDTYKKIRGVNSYDNVIKNIENFSKVKNNNCILGINCVITQDNYEQIYDICNIAKGIGVNNIKFAPLLVNGSIPKYHKVIKNSVEEQLERCKTNFASDSFKIIDKYTDDFGLEENYKKLYKTCWIKEIFTVIGADSKVYFCHQRAYIQNAVIGDLSNMGFKELWFSDEVTNLFKSFDIKKHCNFRCVFDEKNMLLDTLMNLDKNHINFI